jgi:hypothetical protein
MPFCYRASMLGQAKIYSAPRWKVRDKRKFLIASMTELAGDAHLSLEGNLSVTRVLDLAEASGDETAILKRNTTWPVQNFVVLPLETDSIKTIVASIGGTVPRGIIHIQIEKCNKLELGLYDNFGSSFFGSGLTPEFFERLESQGVLTKMRAS